MEIMVFIWVYIPFINFVAGVHICFEPLPFAIRLAYMFLLSLQWHKLTNIVVCFMVGNDISVDFTVTVYSY